LAYLDRLLQPGETVLARARLHAIIYLRSILLLILAAAAAIAGWIALRHTSYAIAAYAVAAIIALVALSELLSKMVLRSTSEFAVTSLRVIVKRGILSLHTVEINLDKIESVDVIQSLFGRMFGYGDVMIHGVGARLDPILGIADPLDFRTAITTRGARAPAPG
jgi:uncharacterized membrane protein YdbT with pleckstrin-like domain